MWGDCVEVPDIYFEEFWGLLNAEKDGGTYTSYTYEDENGLILYRFIKRPTHILANTYDIVTPWGFSGPIIIQCEENKKNALICNFNKDFQEYCIANNIVAEYIRFSPWLKNHVDFKDVYELKYNNYTLGVDLLSNDFFTDEFSSDARNKIRKAEKKGVQIQFDLKCETIKEFYRLYYIMADKNNINENFRFSEDYINNTIKMCKSHIFIMNGIVDGNVASSSMFIYTDKYLHYHLNGNNPEYYPYHVNSLIIAKACEWGKNNNKETLHIGGAFDDSLFHFKRQFTKKGIYDFYIGKKIRLNDLYIHLVELKGKSNSNYFPAYRE